MLSSLPWCSADGLFFLGRLVVNKQTVNEAENSRCRVVLGIRADFYAHCTSHADLINALRDAQLAVGEPSAWFSPVIRGSATGSGYRVCPATQLGGLAGR